MDRYAEIDVEILKHADQAMLVTDGVVEAWIPYSQTYEGDARACRLMYPEGESETIVVKEWIAVERGLL